VSERPERTDPQFLAVARGDAPADLLFTGARIVDVFSRRIIDGAGVAIVGSRIAGVGDYTAGAQVIDLHGSFLAPGLIDAHMHVESTMMLPSEFVRVSSPHGTTGVVLDPHEIANVLGIEGIRLLMDDARGLPMDMMFAASSCVPSAPLETSGAILSAADLAPLFDDPRVVALAEMMNFPGVVNAVPDVLEKLRLGLARRIVDGHCPGLRGTALQAYVAAGVSSDHECTTADEAREKIRAGMRVYIREGSAARNVEALLPAVTPENAHRFCFCTDDRHPGDLQNEGHIDHVVRKAIRLGLDPITAIAMGSAHAADHYRRPDIGAVAPGRFADLIVFDSLDDIRPNRVYFRGELVARDGDFVGSIPPNNTRDRARALGGGVTLAPGLGPDSFRVPASPGATRIRVIGMDPHQLVTAHLIEPANIVDGEHRADTSRDLLKIAVIERHRGSGNMGLGFVRGFGLKRGAIASTIGHDAHNLVVVGTNDADMLAAARTLERIGGGQCVVLDGQAIATLALPIAGLMSDKPAQDLIEEQATLLLALPRLGCELHDPFMPLSFLPLPVIPSLKISDFGLVDVDRFEVTTLEV
jgi:adenine deaminase